MRTNFAWVAAAIASLVPPPAIAQAKPRVPESLAHHCFDAPFVGVYARTKNRDSAPGLQLWLIDPLNRSAGEPTSGERIPDSTYGEVVQIVKLPEHSKALAVEVCNAHEGTYEIKLEEKTSEPYVLDISGNGDVAVSSSLLLHHIPSRRTLHYRFTFHIKGRKVLLFWLDEQGREVPEGQPLEINDW